MCASGIKKVRDKGSYLASGAGEGDGVLVRGDKAHVAVHKDSRVVGSLR